MKIAKIVFGLCAGALLLTGCMTEEPVKQRAADERIELIGTSSFSIDLLSAKTLVNDDGLLTVDAKALLSRTGPIRWFFCGDRNVTVWYHFDWIDSEGNICPPVQREVVVLPGNIVDFHGVAPDEKYINYHLTISLKGPETEEEAARQREELKKSYAKSGKVKPAGKSEAAIVKTNAKPAAKPEEKAEVKSEAKPAEKKAEPKKAAEPQAKKAEPKKAEAKPAAKKAEPKKAEAKPAAGKASKQQKLTEPFD